MREFIVKLGSAAVVTVLVCVVFGNRSLTYRVEQLEKRSIDYFQIGNGLKMAAIHTGFTPQESSNLYASVKEALKIKSWEESKIERLKRDYEQEIRSAKNSIALGYTACRMGINLSNYLAEYEAGMAESLKRRIAEVNETK